MKKSLIVLFRIIFFRAYRVVFGRQSGRENESGRKGGPG